MREKTTRTLYSYWNETRGNRTAPRRFEIEPSRIAEILPETFVLERLAADTYRYRLAGTRICDDFGEDFRGTNFLDGWHEDDRATLVRQFSTLANQAGVGVLTFDSQTVDGRVATFESILLPLYHTRDSVDRFLGSITAMGPPSWLGTAPLMRKRLISHEIVWPDGRPSLTARADNIGDRQSPFLPHIRHARIVRADRRHFRVYEGGLGKPRPEDGTV